MKKIKWVVVTTFLMAAVPLYLNNFELPSEGPFSLTLVYFGFALFMCTITWTIGNGIKGAIVAKRVKTHKKLARDEGKIFYAAYLQHSHFNGDNDCCKLAPKAIKRLISSGYSKTQVYLDVSNAVTNNNFESVNELVFFVKRQNIENKLKAKERRR